MPVSATEHSHRALKALVRHLLENPGTADWTLQGFGMLRCYLEPELRLHVWDSRFRAEEASDLHTHPWNFRSIVVAGRVQNVRFRELTEDEEGGTKMLRQMIRCGEGGGLVGEPERVRLATYVDAVCREGDSYSQLAHEIHRSLPEDGTVTLIEREFLDDTEHAYVYFDGEWGSAEPRPATPEEVTAILTNSLKRWFPGG